MKCSPWIGRLIPIAERGPFTGEKEAGAEGGRSESSESGETKRNGGRKERGGDEGCSGCKGSVGFLVRSDGIKLCVHYTYKCELKT